MATTEGIKKLGLAIMSYYPTAKVDMTSDIDAELWRLALAKADDATILRALQSYVRAGNRFPPSAGEIAAYCADNGAQLQALDPAERRYLGRVAEWLDERRRVASGADRQGLPEARDA